MKDCRIFAFYVKELVIHIDSVRIGHCLILRRRASGKTRHGSEADTAEEKEMALVVLVCNREGIANANAEWRFGY